jgi:hypothetical protein
VKPLTRGLLHPDPRSICPLSSAEFVDPPPEKILGTPLLYFTWTVNNIAMKGDCTADSCYRLCHMTLSVSNAVVLLLMLDCYSQSGRQAAGCADRPLCYCYVLSSSLPDGLSFREHDSWNFGVGQLYIVLWPTVGQWRTEGGGGGLGSSTHPPRNSEVLPKLSRIPSSVEYTSVTT